MQNSHRILNISSIIFKVLAWSALLVGMVGSVGLLVSGGTPATPRSNSAVILFVSALYFVIFFTVSEVIKMLLAIEQNTRK